MRRLAYEAADSGLLSPELPAGIRRVKGVKQLESCLGNWLSSAQAKLLLEATDGEDPRSIRELAMLAVLLGCGLHRAEPSGLEVEDMEVRQGHWVIVGLIGKGSRVRTVPMPVWVKEAVNRWRSMRRCMPPMSAVSPHEPVIWNDGATRSGEQRG